MPVRAERTGVVAVLAQDGRHDARCSGGSEQMMSEMSFSGRDSIPQEGAPGSRNARVRRAVRISSIVAQEVRRVRSRLFVCRCTRYGLCQSSVTEIIVKGKEIIKCYC